MGADPWSSTGRKVGQLLVLHRKHLLHRGLGMVRVCCLAGDHMLVHQEECILQLQPTLPSTAAAAAAAVCSL
jgi:hypothetical protein